MSSPLKHVQRVSVDETFSPVKLPGAVIPNTPELIQHPHGLRAKHEARAKPDTRGRRNTFHNQKPSLTQTPLNATTNGTIFALTSPRAASKNFNLESIKRSKQSLDAKIDGKENRNPNADTSHISDQVSSPIKRRTETVGENDGSARKIAKVITNANESSYNHSDHLIQIDEVFAREDLVGRLSSAKSSPNGKTPIIIDNDSDSDPEDFGRIENTISQTIMPNTSGISTKFANPDVTHTQISKIIKLDEKADYITPQRYTEPVAKSPETNQHVRINEDLNLESEEEYMYTENDKSLKDVTSPLKNYTAPSSNAISRNNSVNEPIKTLDILPETSKLDYEPTINFLMSPHSKPVFSIDQLNKMQADDRRKSDELKETLRERDESLLLLNQNLATLKNDLTSKEQELRDAKDARDSLVRNEEILSIQLKHNERELVSLTKNFKSKENTIVVLQAKLKENKGALEESLSIVDDLTSQVELLTNSNLDNTIKIEALLKEKEELLQTASELTSTNSDLKASNDHFKEMNSKQEELLKELDNLENLANDKIYNLDRTLQACKNDLEDSVSQHKQEKDALQGTIAELEQQMADNEKGESKIRKEIEDLKSELGQSNSLNEKLATKIQNLKEELEANDRQHAIDSDRYEKALEAKEAIISEDATKMNELVEAIELKRATYESEISKLKTGNDKKMKQEIDYLKEQITQQEHDLQKKVDEVATFLHKQYAEKHTRKLGEVRSLYEKEIATGNADKKNLQREVDLLRRKLNRALEEVQRVTEFVHVHKLQYTGASTSPKKGRKY